MKRNVIFRFLLFFSCAHSLKAKVPVSFFAGHRVAVLAPMDPEMLNYGNSQRGNAIWKSRACALQMEKQRAQAKICDEIME